MSSETYMLRRAERKAAFNAYGEASARLELAQIKERLAEILSQHEPLNGVMDDIGAQDRDYIRRKIYSMAYYVVVGRVP